MQRKQGSRPLSAEAAKAVADKVIESAKVTKKVPAVGDVEGQTKAVAGALASALMTATEVPIHVLKPVVGDLAAQLVALGVRQTKHVDPDAVHAPTWIVDGVRDHAVRLPDPPKHTEGEPVVARTAVAPAVPRRISRATRAVRR